MRQASDSDGCGVISESAVGDLAVLPEQMAVGGPLFIAQEDAPLYLAILEDAAGVLRRCATATRVTQVTDLVNALAWFSDPYGELTLEAAVVPVRFADVCEKLRLDVDQKLAELRQQFAVWAQAPSGHKSWSRVGLTRRPMGESACLSA